MIYEGTTRCIGLASASGGGNSGNSFYSMVAVATSMDNGMTWPSYRYQLLSQHHYPVRRMDPGRLREVIEKPMAIVGVPLDSGLADMMIEDAGAQPGALALLDHALDQLWRECKGEVPTYTHYTRCPEVLHLRLLSDAAIRPVVRASESFRFPPASRCQ